MSPLNITKKKVVPQNYLFSFSATRGDFAKAAQNRDIHDIHWFFFSYKTTNRNTKSSSDRSFPAPNCPRSPGRNAARGCWEIRKGSQYHVYLPPERWLGIGSTSSRNHSFLEYLNDIYIYTVYIIHTHLEIILGSIFGMNSILSQKQHTFPTKKRFESSTQKGFRWEMLLSGSKSTSYTHLFGGLVRQMLGFRTYSNGTIFSPWSSIELRRLVGWLSWNFPTETTSINVLNITWKLMVGRQT